MLSLLPLGGPLMEYNILDFLNWQDEATLQRMFTRLLEGLNLFYK